MQTLTEQLIVTGYANRVITEKQLSRFARNDQRRYGLVNRAMKSGELLRLKRGTYVLADTYRECVPHPYALAQSFVAGSYISFETALSFHGWIPEKVFDVASVTPQRKTLVFENEAFGRFAFHPLATREGYLLALVERMHIANQSMFIAKPMRALMDLICLRKVEWQGIEWIIDGLRVDQDAFRSTTTLDIETLRAVYSQKRVLHFLDQLTTELKK